MKKVILTKGLPGSGKTTWAKQLMADQPNAYKRVNKDELRAMLDDSRYSKDAEKFVLRVRDQIILAALEAGKHVIVDDTNLSDKHLARIGEIVKGKAEVEVQDFTDVPIETCIERDLKRTASVGQKVIWRMYWQFIHKPKDSPAFDPSLPKAVICDIDGTLALHNGRGPFEFERCGEDMCNQAVQTVLDGVAHVSLVLLSGREDKYRPQTEEWLQRNSIACDALIMRATGDTRRDDIVKRELYENHVKGKYNVLFVLDDRNRVVDMWRAEGLSCFQVNYGDF